MQVTITVGSYVRIKNQATIGQVVNISLYKVLVAMGRFHFYLPLQAVEWVESPFCIGKKAAQPTNFTLPTQTDPVLDLHGFNKAQAFLAVDKFLDRALLLGYSRLKIIHGQGKGILRRAIRDYLGQHPVVKKVIVQSPIYCMAGMTIVEI